MKLPVLSKFFQEEEKDNDIFSPVNNSGDVSFGAGNNSSDMFGKPDKPVNDFIPVQSDNLFGGDKIPVKSGVINMQSIIDKQRNQSIVDTMKQGASEGIVGNTFFNNDPTDDYIPLTSQYETIDDVLGSEQGREDLAKDAAYEVTKFATDVWAPMLGAAVGGVMVAGVSNPLIAAAVVGSMAFGTYSAMSKASQEKVLGSDAGTILKESAKEFGKGAVTGAITAPVGGLAGGLAGGLTKSVSGKMLGKTVLPAVSELLADEAASTYLTTKIPAMMEGRDPTGIEYFKNAITALPMRKISHGVTEIKDRNPFKLSNGQKPVDYLTEKLTGMKDNGEGAALDDMVFNLLATGTQPEEIKQSMRLLKDETGNRILDDNALDFLDHNINKNADRIKTENIGDILKPKSDLLELRDMDLEHNKVMDKLSDNDKLNDNPLWSRYLTEYEKGNHAKREEFINRALNDPTSDIAILNGFSDKFSEMKDSLIKKHLVSQLYDGVPENQQGILSNIISMPNKLKTAFHKEMARNLNLENPSKVNKMMAKVFWSPMRYIEKHGSKMVSDYIYRQLDPIDAQVRRHVKQVHDQTAYYEKNMTPKDMQDVRNYLYWKQKTASGESAVEKLKWTGKDLGEKSYEELSPMAKDAVDYFSKVVDDIWTMTNQSRILVGKETINPIEGYFPLERQGDSLFEFGRNDSQVEAKIWRNLELGKKENVHTKERTGGGTDKLVDNPFDAMRKYSSYMYQRALMEPATKNIRELADTIKRKQKNMGMQIEKLAAYTSGDYIDATGYKEFLNKLTHATVIGRLTANFSSYFTQFASFAPAIERLGIKPILKSIDQLASDPYLKESNIKKSAHLTLHSSDVSVDEAMSWLNGSLVKNYTKMGMAPIGKMDGIVRHIVWNANYNELIRAGYSEIQAVHEANKYTSFTQGNPSRSYQAPMYRNAVGKLVGTLQSFRINEFHYIVSDVLGLDRSYQFVKHFGKEEGETARTFAKDNKYKMVELEDGTFGVYDKEKLTRVIKGGQDIAALMGLMFAFNMATTFVSSQTGLPLSTPYSDPFDAWFKSKYGISYSDYKAGMTKKGSNKTEREKRIEAAADVISELTKVIPMIDSPAGAAIGGIISGKERLARGWGNASPYEVGMGANDLSGALGNPFAPVVGKVDSFIRKRGNEAKAYIAAQKKGTATPANDTFHNGAVQQYFDKIEKEKRLQKAADRKIVKQEQGIVDKPRSSGAKREGFKKYGSTGGYKPYK